MRKEDVFEVVKAHIMKILPDLSSESITLDSNLKRLIVDSVDRMEILALSMETLRIEASLVQFGGQEKLGGLVEALYRSAEAQ